MADYQFDAYYGSSFSLSTINEDALSWSDRWAFVLDGSTGLNGKRLVAEEGESDAQWYARALAEYLEVHLPAEENSPLPVIFRKASQAVKSSFIKSAKKKIDHPDFPCVLGTAVRIKSDKLEYINIGDCRLLVRYSNGDFSVHTDPALPMMDAESIRIGMKIAEANNTTLADSLPALLPRLREVRSKLNQKDGYIAISDDPDALLDARGGELPLSEIKDFCIISDGFAQYYDLFNLSSAPGFVALASEHDPQSLFRVLTEAQRKDPTLMQYPRFKLSDDATLFYARVSKKQH